MRKLALEGLTPELRELFEAAQRERVLVTRDGQPFGLLVGLENKDAEDLELEFSREFWRMIDARRRERGGMSLQQFMAELEAEEQSVNKAADPVP
jgi:hypothetical protein